MECLEVGLTVLSAVHVVVDAVAVEHHLSVDSQDYRSSKEVQSIVPKPQEKILMKVRIPLETNLYLKSSEKILKEISHQEAEKLVTILFILEWCQRESR
jgi:hypothetical protein